MTMPELSEILNSITELIFALLLVGITIYVLPQIKNYIKCSLNGGNGKNVVLQFGTLRVEATDSIVRSTAHLSDMQFFIAQQIADKIKKSNSSHGLHGLLYFEPEHFSFEPRNVLWVDDKIENHASLIHLLKQLNIDVCAVNSTSQAISKIESLFDTNGHGYDLVITDCVRNGDAAEGVALIKQIRRLESATGQLLPAILFASKKNISEVVIKNFEDLQISAITHSALVLISLLLVTNTSK